MNPFLRMVIVSMAMITGFGSAISGAMILLVAPDPMPGLSVPLLVGGLVMGIGGLVLLVMLNRRYLTEKIEAVKSDPDSIFVRWTDRHGREVLLARAGLIIGSKVHAFDEIYCSLTDIELQPEGVLAIEMRVSGGARSYRPVARIVVPPAHREAVGEAVIALRRLYLGGP